MSYQLWEAVPPIAALLFADLILRWGGVLGRVLFDVTEAVADAVRGRSNG